MKNILTRKIELVALIFLVSFGVFAQSTKVLPEFKKEVEKTAIELTNSETHPMDPVSVNATLVWSKDKSQIAVVVKANIMDGWHIYAYVPETQPYIATELELDLPNGITTIGDWEMSNSEPYGDDIYVYHGTPVFVQYCSVGKYNQGSKLSCGLYYQSCDIRKCFPPQTKTKTLQL